MNAFAAVLFDGARTVRVPVRVDVDGERVTISDLDPPSQAPDLPGAEAGADELHAVVATSPPRHFARGEISADAPIPGVPCRLRLPDGALVETTDRAAVTASWPAQQGIASAAFALESRWWTALGGLALGSVAIWLIVAFALPRAAEPVARLISPRVESTMGRQTLAALDRTIFRKTALPPDRRRDLTEQFDALVADETDEADYRLEFRQAGMPNALALPGGIIVITDTMVEAFDNDAEFRAVMAHELGHVHGRHAVRLVLQDSGLAVLMTALAGDAVGATVLAVALPSVLLRARYSRQFETEADDYAFATMQRRGESPKALADLLRRLQKRFEGEGDSGSMLQYLSTHPATEERIRRLESGQEAPAPSSGK